MDDIYTSMVDVWRRELAETKRLISELKARGSSRVTDQADVARLAAERDRLIALIAAYEVEAAADTKRPLDVNRRAKGVVDAATDD